MVVIRRIIFHGRVQGVNFRSFVEEVASQRPVEGWVRNLGDGTVEAVVSGPDVHVEAVVAQCRLGPRHASVTRVDELPASDDDLKLRKPGEKFSRIG